MKKYDAIEKLPKLKERGILTEEPNTSYLTYVLSIDKETKEMVGFSHY